MKEITYMINEYDFEGDILEEAIFINIGEDVRIKFDNLKDLEEFKNRINVCVEEIKENEFLEN